MDKGNYPPELPLSFYQRFAGVDLSKEKADLEKEKGDK
jgi:hypothetical protein